MTNILLYWQNIHIYEHLNETNQKIQKQTNIKYNLVYYEGNVSNYGEKMDYSVDSLGQLSKHLEKRYIPRSPYIIHKNNSRHTKDLNAKKNPTSKQDAKSRKQY